MKISAPVSMKVHIKDIITIWISGQLLANLHAISSLLEKVTAESNLVLYYISTESINLCTAEVSRMYFSHETSELKFL